MFQSMPSSVGDAHQMPRHQLSVTIHLTQVSSTIKWVTLSFQLRDKLLIGFVIFLLSSNDDGLMLTAVSHQVPNNLLDFNNHHVPFARKWSNWVSYFNNVDSLLEILMKESITRSMPRDFESFMQNECIIIRSITSRREIAWQS